MTPAKELGLYVIVCRPRAGLRSLAKACIENNIPLVQLRDKSATDRELLAQARELLQIFQDAGPTRPRLLINDRPDIALCAGADGVHLGQTDLPVDMVRALLPKGSIVGLSTHSIQQVIAASTQSPDYIGFGPIHPTTTKKDADPITGVEKLREAIALAPCPVVAIGGIFPYNLDEIIAAGAKNVCLVRYLMESQDIDGCIHALQAQISGETSYCEIRNGETFALETLWKID